MNFKNHLLILTVIESLRRHESWTGKTHVQKALSLIRDAGEAEIPFKFVLYKHGPYSFDVETELEQMQSYGAVEIHSNPEGFGVTFQPGDMAQFVREAESLSDAERKAIDRVCRFVGSRSAIELERLATASWIRRQEGLTNSSDIAKRLHSLKPHVSLSDAERADVEVGTWLDHLSRRRSSVSP